MKMGPLLYAPTAGEIAWLEREKGGRIVGVARETDKLAFDWFDPKWGKLYASLQATFPGMQVTLVDSTDDHHVHLVHVGSDRDPGAYYLFNAVAPALTQLGRINSAIDPAKMATREPISFKARDGLELHGYLTRPSQHGVLKHPLIILPHGGPFGLRDSWGFDPDAEFLASRGYAVA